MNPNKTPISRRNRPNTPQSQEDQELGFQAFTQQGYHPQFSQQFPPQFSQQFPQQFPPQFPQQFPQQYHQQFSQQFPYQFTRPGLIDQGFTPANYNLLSPAINLDDDIVPETQPSTPNSPQFIPTQQSNPEPSNPRRTKAAKQTWSKAEELALVSAWVDVSEDPVVGNAQSGGSFWARIGQVFFTRMGREPGYRSTHQLNSKFSDVNKRVNSFGGIYNNLLSNRSSGMSEADISRTAHERYVARHNVAFTHEQAWDILKKCPKWGAVPTMTTTSSRGSKRTQTSDDDDDETIQRPIGRNKAKKISTSNTSGTNTDESVNQLLTTFNDKFDGAIEYKMKKLDVELQRLEHERELERAKRFDADFQFYITSHDHLSDRALMATLKRKEQIKKYHDWNDDE